MKRRLAILSALLSLLAVGNAHAEPLPGLPPELLPPRLLTEVGAPAAPPTPFRSGFSVHAKGYEVEVFTFGSALILEVGRGNRKRAAATIYAARGVAVPDRMQATFGRFGKVSMRFRPDPRRRATWRCDLGERERRRPGSYVGYLSFRGENGYVSLDLHRARGSILTPVGRCHRHVSRARVEREIEALFEPVAGLFAASREGIATTDFAALKQKRRAVFYALRKETHGRLAILRFAWARASKGLHANEAVTAASSSPPAPFHGVGIYRASPDGTTTWSGSLSVDFPGALRFPLTGPSFKASLEVPF